MAVACALPAANAAMMCETCTPLHMRNTYLPQIAAACLLESACWSRRLQASLVFPQKNRGIAARRRPTAEERRRGHIPLRTDCCEHAQARVMPKRTMRTAR